MKKFEYKNFHKKPLLQLTQQQFADFILETLNEIGQQGWQAITVHTPHGLNQQGQPVLSGDLFILAMREKIEPPKEEQDRRPPPLGIMEQMGDEP